MGTGHEQHQRHFFGIVAGAAAGTALSSASAFAASAREIDREVNQSLRTLYATLPKARDLAKHAKAILVFPRIVKAGLIVGGQGGDGALRVNGRTVGYYNIAAASFGLQAGVQTFSYALFFMNDAALSIFRRAVAGRSGPARASWSWIKGLPPA
jgi:lipid-binding SYLF domain-containing protein